MADKGKPPGESHQNEKGQGQPESHDDHVVTWDEFINRTTFHGVKYIFNKNIKWRMYSNNFVL